MRIVQAGARPLLWAALIAALVAEILLNGTLRPLRPVIGELPPPPSAGSLAAQSLGDRQFLFRVNALWLQDFGDGGGRLKPLRDFDYTRIVGWLRAVDDLDRRSQAVFVLGTQFFGALTDPASFREKVKLIADYFEQAGMADPAGRWPWLSWAASTIAHRVKDPALAQRTAEDILSLRDDKDVPDWLPLLSIPLLQLSGDWGAVNRLSADPDMIARRRRALETQRRMMGDNRP